MHRSVRTEKTLMTSKNIRIDTQGRRKKGPAFSRTNVEWWIQEKQTTGATK
jgi:hypothetical protein